MAGFQVIFNGRFWVITEGGVAAGTEAVQLLGELSLYGPEVLERARDGLRRDLEMVRDVLGAVHKETGHYGWRGWPELLYDEEWGQP